MNSENRPGMVIIGGGHCGGRAALCLRETGWKGEITLIGEEDQLPYERPPLSKAFLAGLSDIESLHLTTEPGWRQAGITLRLNCRVAGINRAAKVVQLTSGERIPYHRLLLATGGSARCLSLPGSEVANIYTLRTHADADRLRAVLRPGRRVVMIGGGFIGLEIAATASQTGCDVTLVEGADRLLSRAVPAVIAERVQALHRQHGVTLSFGCLPVEFLRHSQGTDVVLQNGCRLSADVIIAGVGMTPRTELARAAGLEVDQGIVVDALLRTRDPNIFAAGDVCQFPSLFSGTLMRQETWLNAEAQARVAAINMAGGNQPYDSLPWFWSDQYDHTLQVCGEPALASTSVMRTLPQDALLIFYLHEDGRLIGCSGFGLQSVVNKELKIARRLVERQSSFDKAALCNGSMPLKKLLTSVA